MDFGAFASAGGSVINGMLGYIANERTNEQNLDISRENREWQERMYQLQLSDQERLYNKYNSPEAMVRQYDQAGLNPNIMMQHGAAGQSNINSSVPSSPSSIPMQAYHPNLDFSAFVGSDLRSAQAENIQASTDAQRIKNQFAVLQELADLYEKRSRSGLSDTQKKELDEQIEILKTQKDFIYETQSLQNENLKADLLLKYEQKTHQILVNNYQSMVNESFPALSDAQLTNLRAATNKAYADAHLSNKMSESEVQKKALLITQEQCESLRRDGIKVNQNDVHRINQANYRYINTMRQKVHNSDNWVNNWSPLVSGTGSAAAAAILK